jgi:hypothetical protein
MRSENDLRPDFWPEGDEAERTTFAGITFGQSPEARSRARFNELVAQWRKEIGHKSSLRKIVFNRPYLSIMLMAADDQRHKDLITGFILQELKEKGGHWFWALHVITGASPAQFGDSLSIVRDAWIGWGRTHGYLKD